jgi:hypothetical protein
MSIEDKEKRIKMLLTQIPQSSSFASVSLTKEIMQLTEEIEQEKLGIKKQANQTTNAIPD